VCGDVSCFYEYEGKGRVWEGRETGRGERGKLKRGWGVSVALRNSVNKSLTALRMEERASFFRGVNGYDEYVRQLHDKISSMK
jgi:hypothetical protein